MRWGVVVVALLIATPVFADDQPPLDTALARARHAGKPLVIELYADWCGPCVEFDKRVLSRDDVKQALQAVVFVRYDIDHEPGDAIREALDIEGVPAFVVFDAAGNVVERHKGLWHDPRAGFLALIQTAVRGKTLFQELERYVESDPTNDMMRMRLAAELRSLGRNADAIEQLTWVAEHGQSVELAARAAAQRDELRLVEVRLDEAVAAAERFVEMYPGSRLASPRLVALALSGRVPQDRIKVLAMAHLDSVASTTWPRAVRAALLVNGLLLAQASIDERVAKRRDDRVAMLMHAELMLYTGKTADAARLVERACRVAGEELWCFALRQALDLSGRGVPTIEHLRAEATRYLQGTSATEHDHSLYALADGAPHVGNAIADAFADAQLRCEHLATRDTHALIVLRFTRSGHASHVIARTSANPDLERCVTRALRDVRFQQPVSAVRVVQGAITFKAARGKERPPQLARLAGIAPQLAVRQGDWEMFSFRADALIEVADAPRGTWVIGAGAELGGSDRGEPAYAARVLVGHGLPLYGLWTRVIVLAGLGVSDLSTESPLALELPIEARLLRDFGRLRLHVSSSATSRVPARMNASSWLSDVTYGVAASVRFGEERRVYLGVQREEREGLGTNVLFTFGTTVGDAY